MKNLCCKQYHQESEKTTRNGKNICISHISQGTYIQNKYRTLTVNNKKANKINKTWAKDLKKHFFKKYKSSAST